MHQDGFHLVVGMVPHHNTLGGVVACEVEQDTVAANPCGFFDAKPALLCVLAHIAALRVERQAKISRVLAQGFRLGG